MDTKICMDDVNIIKGKNTFLIQRDDKFLVFGNSIYNNGTFKVRSIINYFLHHPYETDVMKQLTNKEFSDPYAIILTNDKIKHVVKTLDSVTAIVWADISRINGVGEIIKDDQKNKGSVNTILLINKNLATDLLIKSYSWAIESKISALWDLDLRNHNNDLFTGYSDDNLIVACIGESEEVIDEKKLRTLIKTCVREATRQSILNNGYSKSIIDYIQSIGIKIEDLVEAGMELCIGVQKSEKLNEKLYKQILKSLEDINVVSFIIAGIRLEEDYKKHRVAGINVDDDPAHLYSDEVLGMSIANQIAGTKAIFNFKRYDEDKPGVIGELGPVLDDVFAGLVAGCMSKIFED